MSLFLNISAEEFIVRYTRNLSGRLSLTESRKTYDCVFLKDSKCLVYGARPTQCRTFPFWPQNLSSKEAWENLKNTCEGIHPQASPVSHDAIETQKLLQIKRNLKH